MATLRGNFQSILVWEAAGKPHHPPATIGVDMCFLRWPCYSLLVSWRIAKKVDKNIFHLLPMQTIFLRHVGCTHKEILYSVALFG